MKLQEPLFAEVRKQKIAEIVAKNGRTTVAALCELFSVSPATIRNDLRELEESGSLKRTHGGAISSQREGHEPNTFEKEVQNVEYKRIIAQAALAYIQPGDIIALDTGTTTYELAKLLPGIEQLTVITNDLQIASFLEQETDATIIIAGGTVRQRFHCTTGQLAIDTIANLHTDKVFVAANGVHIIKGITTPNMETANFKSRMIDSADEVFVLADHSKLNKSSFIAFAPFSKIDVLITDDQADQNFVRDAAKFGIEVICASVENH